MTNYSWINVIKAAAANEKQLFRRNRIHTKTKKKVIKSKTTL